MMAELLMLSLWVIKLPCLMYGIPLDFAALQLDRYMLLSTSND